MKILSIVLQTSIRHLESGDYLFLVIGLIVIYFVRRWWNKQNKNKNYDSERTEKDF